MAGTGITTRGAVGTAGIEVLEQKDVLDYDTDGNTTEIARSYYHRNALGSVMEITDANETIAVSYRYDPYGKVTITRNGQAQSADPLGQHWVFTGRFLDEESGLLYYRARYYDPGLGRFLQRDPLGYAEGPSLFTCAGSNPTNRTDPSGLAGMPWWVPEGEGVRVVFEYSAKQGKWVVTGVQGVPPWWRPLILGGLLAGAIGGAAAGDAIGDAVEEANEEASEEANNRLQEDLAAAEADYEQAVAEREEQEGRQLTEEERQEVWDDTHAEMRERIVNGYYNA